MITNSVEVQVLAALRRRGVRPGRERPKPEMPRPWQQALAAAEGRPFDPSAPSLTAQTPLEPWQKAESTGFDANAPADRAAASRVLASEGTTAAKAGASIAGATQKAPACRPGMRGGVSSWRSLSLWRRWRMRRKCAEARTHEAMRALPLLKRVRAARLPMVPKSAVSPRELLRHTDAVVEAVSSFQRAGKSGRDLDRTFLLLAYASTLPPHSRAHDSRQQGSAAAQSCITSPPASQRSKAVPAELQHVSSATAAEGPAAQQQAARPDKAQVPWHDRRLSFQPAGGFAASGSKATMQQGNIPDLIGLMCGAALDSTPDSGSSQGSSVVDMSDAGVCSDIPYQQCLHASSKSCIISALTIKARIGRQNCRTGWVYPACIASRRGVGPGREGAPCKAHGQC